MDPGKKICLSKKRYKNRRMTWHWAAYYFKLLGSESNIYKCKYGKHFHLTTKSPMPPHKKTLVK